MPAVVPMPCSAAAADVRSGGNWGTAPAGGPSEPAGLQGTPPLPAGCSCWGKRGAAPGTGGGVSAPGRSWWGDTCSRTRKRRRDHTAQWEPELLLHGRWDSGPGLAHQLLPRDREGASPAQTGTDTTRLPLPPARSAAPRRERQAGREGGKEGLSLTCATRRCRR